MMRASKCINDSVSMIIIIIMTAGGYQTRIFLRCLSIHSQCKSWTSWAPNSSFCLREKLEADKPGEMNLQQVEVTWNDRFETHQGYEWFRIPLVTTENRGTKLPTAYRMRPLRKSGNWPGALFLLRTGWRRRIIEGSMFSGRRLHFPIPQSLKHPLQICAEECLDVFSCSEFR